ncbi:hypothetical protein G9A89_023366 [Geosiphon pyriformis]|nr:hypothetical protein G9A89_023366 [Geosiphon pyriformis]
MSTSYKSPSSVVSRKTVKKTLKNDAILKKNSYDPMEIDGEGSKRQTSIVGPVSNTNSNRPTPRSIVNNVTSATNQPSPQTSQQERYYNKSNESQEQYQQQQQQQQQQSQSQGFSNFADIDNKKVMSTSQASQQAFYASDLNMIAAAAVWDINMLVDVTLSRTSLDPEVVLAAAQLFQFANQASCHANAANGAYFVHHQSNNQIGSADAVSRPSAMSLSNLLLPSDDTSASSSQTGNEKKLFPDDKALLSFH